MVTTKKKIIINTQKEMRKESKHNTKENNQTRRKREREETERNCKNIQKQFKKWH